ncbi:MAG: 16S rRNA (guanine(966)-N(2))-methyltransferase RsmD, partial [Firmicutes bacterium]|nr:16S rRNA (guanine(966)-N(2))-methyltransferase RsmD [Bacillota bacterium]
MRVITGTAKGRRLQSLKGQRTRPTADRVKESMFAILGQQATAGWFLDLYAGSGAIGIEALSRGAP